MLRRVLVNAAGAITMHGPTSQLLSGIGTALTGTRTAYDSTFFAEQTIPVLVKQMEASRTSQREIVVKQLKASVTDYPLASALSDVVDYYLAGTLVNALGEITGEANTKLNSAREEERVRVNEEQSPAVDPEKPELPSEPGKTRSETGSRVRLTRA